MPAKSAARPRYDVHPSMAIMTKWVSELKSKTGRSLDTGGFAKKDRITHRIALASVAEIDDEVKRWMKTAYELDA